MVNSEMIRINELVKITSSGFIVKLHATAKLPDLWPQLVQTFLEDARSQIASCFEEGPNPDPETLSRLQAEVKLLQHNNTARATLQLPFCAGFGSLHALLDWSAAQCERLSAMAARHAPRSPVARVACVVGRMSLEQAFLAYASHQTPPVQD